ncbi:MAG: bifunctional glutamate N-acetyltransferase/amino-acid acetyltransferase ArgJ [Clostridium sp.]
MEIIQGGVTSPKGFLASGIFCGLKKNTLKKDLALIYSEVPSIGAGVYTKNKVKGAPIFICKDHLSNKKARAIIVNSGNANTCNGEDGLMKAKKMASLQAKALKLKTDEILVASTGVIGVPLNIDAIKDGIPLLTSQLSSNGGNDAATAIMTTDTFSKQCAIKITINGVEVTLGGMAKGSGMIEPNMATMLSFITTDINISPALLDASLKECVSKSFNRISVDGDCSTNDTVLILANGEAKNPIIDSKNTDFDIFKSALQELCIILAKMVAKDGEGATKLLECVIKGAKTQEDGVKFSKSVINSSLVKTAMFGSDANWGRILCALGYANIEFDTSKVDVSFESSLGSIKVCEKGSSLPFDEVKAKEILLQDDIKIIVDLSQGDESVSTWGCDLSYDYVKINGDYRS